MFILPLLFTLEIYCGMVYKGGSLCLSLLALIIGMLCLVMQKLNNTAVIICDTHKCFKAQRPSWPWKCAVVALGWQLVCH